MAGRPAPPPRPAPTQHLGARRSDRYKLDGRFVAVEQEIGEWAKDMRHRARQAGRLIYRKRKPVKKGKRYKLRVAGRGLVYVGRVTAGGAAVTVAGAYLTTRWTARHTKRAVKYAAPHVRKVAGHTARAAHAYGKVYGGAAYQRSVVLARKANRKAVRARAKNGLRITKMRSWVAGSLDRAHTKAYEKGRDRRAKALLAGAIRIAPKHRNSMLSGMKPASNQMRAQRAEEAAMREAQRVIAKTEREQRRRERDQRRPQGKADRRGRGLDRPGRGHRGGHVLPPQTVTARRLPRPLDSANEPKPIVLSPPSRDGGVPARTTKPSISTVSQSQSPRPTRTASSAVPATTARGGIVMAQRNPAAQLEKAFNELADFTPEDYQDWMHLLLGLVKAFRAGAESVTVLASRMDVQERMDPRSLQDFYLTGEPLLVVMQLFGNSGKKFWALYQDRVEPNSGRGRTMRDENKFFQQP
ncbi:hypothetical protein BAY61_31730 (plasmid) [Prauserella marina]|nr:hypothetical protein BAY61_31730 [Prauserella marina]